jgi:cell division protein FtsN
MAKDHVRPRRSPPWVWLLAGLAIGLFVAFLVYLGEHHASNTSDTPANNNSSATANALRKEASASKEERLKTGEQPEPPKPRFEFYTILPEMEVQAPEHEITSSSLSKTQKTNGNVNRSGNPVGYVLQVGSFRNHRDADRLKAELALIGLRADIQVVSLGGEGTWHRVRLGPYKDPRALDEARDLLSEHDMRAIVLKERN